MSDGPNSEEGGAWEGTHESALCIQLGRLREALLCLHALLVHEVGVDGKQEAANPEVDPLLG